MNSTKMRYTGKDRGFARRMGYDDGGDVADGSDSSSNDYQTAAASDATSAPDSSGTQAAGDNSMTAINSEVAPQVASNADWNKFESEARPSTNVEDVRGKSTPAKYIPSFGSVVAQTGGLTDTGE